MSFIYPSFLLAFSALAIPVLIHWFNLRKDKVVWFTHLKFLKEVKETSSRKRKLKHWLILLCRVLFLSFLVLLFAQPYIPGIDKTSAHKEILVSIYLDNSQSMTAENAEGPLFYQALKKAEEIISGFSPQTKFQLLTNDFKAGSQSFQSSRKIKSELAEIKISPVFRTLESVYRRQESFFSQFPGGNKYIFWLSDFQKSTAGDIKQIKADTSALFFLIPLKPDSDNNLYIDSVFTENPFIRPGTSNKLFVRVVNAGSRDIKNLPIRMMLDTLRSGTSQINISPKSKEIAEFNFTVYDNFWKKGIIEFDDNPVSFDNHYFFSFKPSRKINILYIFEGENKNYMEKVFSSDSVFQYRQFPYRTMDYSSLNGMNLIILDGIWNPNEALSTLLLRNLENGGSLCIFPPKELPRENQAPLNLGKKLNFFSTLFDKTPMHSPVWKTRNNPEEIETNYFSPSESEEDSANIYEVTPDEGISTYSNLAPVKLNNSQFWEGVFDIPSAGKTKASALTENMDMPKAVARILWENAKKINRQDIIQFRNEEPYFSVFNTGNGKIFLFASEPLSHDCNLALHALFVPIVYRMAIASAKNIPIAWSLQYPSVEIPASSENKEGIYKLLGKNIELIPQSRLSGDKLYLDIPREIALPGHYLLSGYDDMIVSLNTGKEESQLQSYSDNELKTLFPKLNRVHFPEVKGGSLKNYLADYRWGKSLWEYCLYACLFFVLGEVLVIQLWRK